MNAGSIFFYEIANSGCTENREELVVVLENDGNNEEQCEMQRTLRIFD